MKHIRRQLGFTYIELLVTIGVLGIVTNMGILTFQRSYHDSRLVSEVKEIAQVVRDVQQRSVAAHNGVAWGVRCVGNGIELFTHAGAVEVTRGMVNFSPRISCTVAGSSIKFKKLSGAPMNLPARITIQELSVDAYTIDSNAVGTVILTAL